MASVNQSESYCARSYLFNSRKTDVNVGVSVGKSFQFQSSLRHFSLNKEASAMTSSHLIQMITRYLNLGLEKKQTSPLIEGARFSMVNNAAILNWIYSTTVS